MSTERDPRNDPQPGDVVVWRGEIQSRVTQRNRNYVVAYDGRFTISYRLAEWRSRCADALVLHTEPPK